MAEVITKTDGDALSKLIQLQAGRYGIRLAWVGKGVEDLTALLHAHAIKARMAKHLWTGMRELMAMPEMNKMPEPVQVQIASVILKAQALLELENEEEVKRVAALSLSKAPKGSA